MLWHAAIAMGTLFVCANTLTDVVRSFLTCRLSGGRFRCVHNGAIAGVVAACNVDPTTVAAGLFAIAGSRGKSLADLPAIVLPPDAHTVASRSVVIISRTDDGIKATRRWATRAALLASIADAAAAPSWVPGGERLSTAFAIRGARVVRAGHATSVHPSGDHPVAASSISVTVAAATTARCLLLKAP